MPLLLPTFNPYLPISLCNCLPSLNTIKDANNNGVVVGEEKAPLDDEVFVNGAASTTPVAETTPPLPNGVLETRVVTHPYEGKDEDELTLTVGQVVNVTTLEVSAGEKLGKREGRDRETFAYSLILH